MPDPSHVTRALEELQEIELGLASAGIPFIVSNVATSSQFALNLSPEALAKAEELFPSKFPRSRRSKYGTTIYFDYSRRAPAK